MGCLIERGAYLQFELEKEGLLELLRYVKTGCLVNIPIEGFSIGLQAVHITVAVVENGFVKYVN